MIKAIVSFVIGNSFWDFLIESVASTQEIITVAVLLVVIIFVFNRFRASRDPEPPPPPPPSPSPPPPPSPMPEPVSPTLPVRKAPLFKTTAKLKAVSGSLKGQEWILTKGTPLTVGRRPECNIRFAPEDTTISGKHCEIELRDDGVWIRDIGSKNGTFFRNGQILPVDQWERVCENFYLASKDYMFSLELHDA